MIIKRQRRVILFYAMTLVAISIMASDDVSATENSAGMLENAHAKELGSGWLCDRGYEEVDGICNAIRVPENAFPTDSSFNRG